MDPQRERRRRMAFATAVAILLLDYYQRRTTRIPRMTSTFVGDRWVSEMLSGHPIRFRNIFRMTRTIFMDLLNELCLNHGLHGSSRTLSREVLAITLYILAQNESIRGAMERFQHSSETISRYFSKGIQALISLAAQIIKPEDPSFATTPEQIANDPRYMPYFKNCIGAIDGTHVDARIPNNEKVAYIGRSGSTTQNVMAVCDFNMCFTFVVAGWEGSAHDSRIFSFATRNRSQCFPHPPAGKYYLVDAGYPMQRGYLKPYSDTRYHLPDFERASGTVRGRKEMFNKRHSSLRGVIERTFGVWKKKWVILRDMPSYPFQKQVYIVVATMALHNFIRRHSSQSDTDFSMADNDELNILEQPTGHVGGHSLPEEDIESNDFEDQDADSLADMIALRESITDAICGY
ncbi:putative nuclease HARBI1 [Phalaenopsis equestris]|uniref:putative nuclease HARBI1 n=1 Tax=Phalaenopsis equestris TaxID=78828 RepID=UPI0009E2E52D|nr:putative nuclease HARBI1 [Phalaenopsis equestris]XP_020587422.1 putative nuclease HARBI1 [Phalaenopsis equestris]XP_020595641.1 putative nuclease HARBI1 [Phalaenopsis equestris]XP_020599895.1 putative nuclease HARBI1 [Phalaenopsis equestris]